MAKFNQFLVAAVFGLFGVTSALPQYNPFSLPKRDTTSCTDPIQRKPWSRLTSEEQSGYLNATLCLMSLPATLGIDARAESRWDELQWAHILQTNWMHSNGHFLPWHRYYVTVHAHMLRDECGYTGSIPYWDEPADATLTHLNESVMFQPDSFGGDGELLDGDTAIIEKCVRDGPFVNQTLRLWYDTSNTTEYCIYRNLSDTALASGTTQADVDACMTYDNYTAAWTCFAGTIHGQGHSAVRGVMGHVANAPGDPMFFLHHTWLDAMWWKWQSLNLTSRLTDIGGPVMPSASFLSRNTAMPTPGAEYLDYDGDDGNVTTLNHVLWMVGNAENVTVAEVMDVRGDVVCAEYVY